MQPKTPATALPQEQRRPTTRLPAERRPQPTKRLQVRRRSTTRLPTVRKPQLTRQWKALRRLAKTSATAQRLPPKTLLTKPKKSATSLQANPIPNNGNCSNLKLLQTRLED